MYLVEKVLTPYTVDRSYTPKKSSDTSHGRGNEKMNDRYLFICGEDPKVKIGEEAKAEARA